MARYIDAEDLRGRVKTATNPYGKPTLDYESGVKVLNMIDQQPTADVVEVVRCKDCKLRDTEGCPFMAWDCGELMGDTEDNDYCSHGERKE